jgi:hypothetical protein
MRNRKQSLSGNIKNGDKMHTEQSLKEAREWRLRKRHGLISDEQYELIEEL